MMQLLDSRHRALQQVDLAQPVTIYSCGYTPRERIHLGNARPFYLADLVRRVARMAGGSVQLIQDVSDVDDRVEEAARATGTGLEEFVGARIREFLLDSDAIGIGRPTSVPRASEHMSDVIDLIVRLQDRGLTVCSPEGLTMSVPEALHSSSLKVLDPEGAIRSMMCFTGQQWDVRQELRLWQVAAEPSWDSPWGPGRPNENIICAALAYAYLGTPMAVHVGSVDIYSHHEIEMAVGGLAFRAEYARTWIHSGVVEVSGRRMANSANNVQFVADAVAKYGADAVRMLYLSTHHSHNLDASPRALRSAATRVSSLRSAIRAAPTSAGSEPTTNAWLRDALLNDLNTPEALDRLEQLVGTGLTRAAADEAMQMLGFAPERNFP